MIIKKNIDKMLNRILKICIFGIFFTGVQEVSATHIVGGGITYKALGNNRYEITLNLRRDCGTTNGQPHEPFDNVAYLAAFSEDGSVPAKYFSINKTVFDTLDVPLVSDCGFIGSQVCVSETKYVTIVTLPRPNSGGYTVVHQRCCRNGSINNIVDPINVGASFTAYISNAAINLPNSEVNNSPVFVQWPAIYICAGTPLNFDHSATDADGDSLVYTLCTPKIGATKPLPRPTSPSAPPYDDLIWLNPYGLPNLMGGVPLAYNINTGVFTGTPNAVGQYVIGVCVSEYRDGVLLSKIIRDFQYNVRVCSQPPLAEFTAPLYNCNTLTVPFTNTSLATNDFTWFFNYPDTSAQWVSNEKDPVFTFPSSGIYQVKLVAIRGTDQCRDELIREISVFDIPYIADFETKLRTCNNNGTITVLLLDASSTAAPGVTSAEWHWTITQNGNTSIYNGNSVNATIQPGKYTVTLNVTASNQCQGTATKDFDFEDQDLETDFSLSLPGCGGSESITIQPNDLSPGINPEFIIASSHWVVTTANGTIINANGLNPLIEIPKDSFTLSLVSTAGNGCKADTSKSYNATDFLPIPDFTFGLTGCNPENTAIIRFTENTEENTTFGQVSDYNWIVGGLPYNGGVIDALVAVGDTINALMTAVLTNGCEVSLSKQFILDQIRPQIAYDYTEVGCESDSTVKLSFAFNGEDTNGLPHGIINWLVGVPSNPALLSGALINITLPKDSLLSLKLFTKFNNGCSDTVSANFLPGPFATLEILADSLVLCPYEEAHLIKNGNPAFTYHYSPTEGLDTSIPSDPIVTIDKDKTYTITVSDGLCSVTKNVVVDILESIPLFIEGNEITCNGDIDLKVSGAIGAGVYEWSTNSFFSPVIFTGDRLQTNFTGKQQKYFVRYKADAGEVCKPLGTDFTIVNQTPGLDYLDPFELCPGDTVKFPVINADPSHQLTVLWQTDPHLISGETTLNPTIGLALGETDSVTLYVHINNQFGCPNDDSLRIKVGVNPTAEFTYVVEDCNNFNVCFEVTGNFNGFPNWDFGDPTTTADKSLLKKPCYTYPDSGRYTVLLTNNVAICPFFPLTVDVQLNKGVLIFEGSNDEACQGAEYNLNVPSNVVDLNYKWYDIIGVDLGSANPLKIIVNGDQQRILKVEDINGCPFQDTFEVKAFIFTHTLDTPEVFCNGQEADASIHVDGNLAYIYDWSPKASIISGGTTANVTVAVDKKETITIKVTHPTLGCVLTDNFEIDPASVDFTVDAFPDAEIYKGQSVDIEVADGQPGWKYQWENGPQTKKQTVSPIESTTYVVTVTDEEGCTGTADVRVDVILIQCSEDVFLPTAFSPNGDGANDVLMVRSNSMTELELIIYNRWGEKMFSTTSVNGSWDGTFQGATVNTDVYAYYLRARCGNGEEIVKQGNVSLLK